MQNIPGLPGQPGYHMVPLEEQQLTGSAKAKDDAYVPVSSNELKSPLSAASLLSSAVPPPFPPTAYDHQAAPRLQPRRLGPDWTRRFVWLFVDLCVATLALLFAVYGFLVNKHDGSPAADGNSTGRKLYNISLYAPTVFPVLFAAVVGGCLKAIASYSLQTGRGATVGMLEQCLGSQSIYRALSTQIRMHAFNPLGILLVVLWSLSPLGGQASLRVISIVPHFPQNTSKVLAVDTFQEYAFGSAEGSSEALTSVSNPAVASMMGASLLGGRNQDLWGNVRLPAIEPLEAANSISTDGWYSVGENTNMTYASLVGTPVSQLPSTGNTSFILPGAYMSISCPVFGLSSETSFTNYTPSGNNTVPDPGNGFDCSWVTVAGGTQYQLALSLPCSSDKNTVESNTTTRAARKLVWDSWSQQEIYTHAECDVSTTHVDANITCSGSDSGLSTASTCSATHVRRSVSVATDRNWTVLDTGSVGDAGALIRLLAAQFPYAQLSGGMQPVVVYMSYPFSAVGVTNNGKGDTPTFLVGVATFQLRLAQLLNSILYIGISPPSMTGAFNESDAERTLALGSPGPAILQANATNTVETLVVQRNKPWLAVLIVASLIMFGMALVGAILRLLVLVPDVLESVTLSFLHHQTEGVSGASIWSAAEWARANRCARLFFGDVEPSGDAGRIGLSNLGNMKPVAPVQVGRIYL